VRGRKLFSKRFLPRKTILLRFASLSPQGGKLHIAEQCFMPGRIPGTSH